MKESPIQRLGVVKSMRVSVEESLSAAIVLGEISAGQVLTVPTLAEQFGVSATPVREAMLEMAKRGFVDPLRNKGYRVTAVNTETLRSLLQVRRWLEAPAMQQLAASFPDERRHELRRNADATVHAAHAPQLSEFLAADMSFHLALLEALGNLQLVQVVRELRRHTRLAGPLCRMRPEELERSAREHHLLLDLLESGEGEAAAELTRRHIGYISGV